MAQRHQMPQATSSHAIRQEIQRFESVHPSIYAIYDFIEAITDPILQQQIREHVVCIEDSFVNSQEWTISRAVPDIRLGVLGTVNSGKSALVHRYLTGSYMQEESPEGGRFKKEVSVENQSYLLLIRDEGGPPEKQFTHWVDAIVLVFSLESESSFQAVYNYYAKMAHFRSTTEIPVILVGTQDFISESNPRVIDDTRARKLAADLKKCTYYETCATYGLNVEKVFQDACQRVVSSRAVAFSAIVQQQLSPKQYAPANKVYDTPQGSVRSLSGAHASQQGVQASPYRETVGGLVGAGSAPAAFKEPVIPRVKKRSEEDVQTRNGDSRRVANVQKQGSVQKSNSFSDIPTDPPQPSRPLNYLNELQSRLRESGSSQTIQSAGLLPANVPRQRFSLLGERMESLLRELSMDTSPSGLRADKDKELPTPSSTPTQSRKNRRRSNLFTPNKKEEVKRESEVGSGRSIPVKQGHLYKKSKGLNREWKKKYVSLTSDGRLMYYPSLHDYMEDVHGKEVKLSHTTVKVPGQPRPRAPRSLSSGDRNSNGSLGAEGSPGPPEERLAPPGSTNGFAVTFPPVASPHNKAETPSVKKRHRRAKSSTGKNLDVNGEDSDGYEFVVVSLENKQWHFEASCTEERECWVAAIEQQILSSLQGNISAKTRDSQLSTPLDQSVAVQAIRSVPGNDICADCGAPKPDWASLNLGALICIECSGVHRHLGTHISRVRSLDLDDWPAEYTAVMTSIGNPVTNSVWEAQVGRERKPSPAAAREEKERWIRAKYEQARFLATSGDVTQQLVEAIAAGNTSLVLGALAAASQEQVNGAYPGAQGRAAIHMAAALGNVVYLQLLIWYGADVTLLDTAGRSPLQYARSANGASASACTQMLIAASSQQRASIARR